MIFQVAIASTAALSSTLPQLRFVETAQEAVAYEIEYVGYPSLCQQEVFGRSLGTAVYSLLS